MIRATARLWHHESWPGFDVDPCGLPVPSRARQASGLESRGSVAKLRLYLPAGAAGVEMFARLVDRFRLLRVGERKAA